MKYLLYFIFFLSCAELTCSTVLVIGGGPTGIGAAIEARLALHDVILVEKREQYTRLSTMSLSHDTLAIFEKWNVAIPLLQVLDFNGTRRGFILLKDLEQGLYSRADELGVQRIHGEFIDFAHDSALIHTARGDQLFAYEILVGADGAHSLVRQKLGIECRLLGESSGGIVMVPATHQEGKLTVEFQPHPHLLTKKVSIPTASVLFFQNRPMSSEKLSLPDMIRLAREIGWQQDALKMASENCIALENIPIYLQCARCFSDPTKSVILLGDAAAAASFYSGAGVNFCFKTTQLAGKLFGANQQEKAHEQFNHDMAIEVEQLINLNLPFF